MISCSIGDKKRSINLNVLTQYVIIWFHNRNNFTRESWNGITIERSCKIERAKWKCQACYLLYWNHAMILHKKMIFFSNFVHLFFIRFYIELNSVVRGSNLCLWVLRWLKLYLGSNQRQSLRIIGRCSTPWVDSKENTT